MGLHYVNGQESNLIPILFVKLVERRNLPPEGWSSVAAKYQDNRLPRTQRGELNSFALVQSC